MRNPIVLIFMLAALLMPAVVSADPKASTGKTDSQIGPVQNLTGQILSGRIQEVETRFMTGISGHIEEMGRLRADARRRNDALAASCVEQKLVPAQNLRSAATRAASRLRGLPEGQIEALNHEVRSLSTAADRVGELSNQARSCVKINSGQVVGGTNMAPEVDIEEPENKKAEHVADHIVPPRPDASRVD